MLTKVLALVLVVLIGLALGIETARMVHAHAAGVDVSGAVNIHHALGFGLLATSGALLLSLSREWFSRHGWVGWCGGKLRSYLGLRILLAKWVGGARVKA